MKTILTGCRSLRGPDRLEIGENRVAKISLGHRAVRGEGRRVIRDPAPMRAAEAEVSIIAIVTGSSTAQCSLSVVTPGVGTKHGVGPALLGQQPRRFPGVEP
jgi:hypothetical protein